MVNLLELKIIWTQTYGHVWEGFSRLEWWRRGSYTLTVDRSFHKPTEYRGERLLSSTGLSCCLTVGAVWPAASCSFLLNLSAAWTAPWSCELELVLRRLLTPGKHFVTAAGDQCGVLARFICHCLKMDFKGTCEEVNNNDIELKLKSYLSFSHFLFCKLDHRILNTREKKSRNFTIPLNRTKLK